MLPIVDTFKSSYIIKRLVVIADSELLTKNNINDMQNKGYEFIFGSRIKNETTEIKKKILALNKTYLS
jgi:transposase